MTWWLIVIFAWTVYKFHFFFRNEMFYCASDYTAELYILHHISCFWLLVDYSKIFFHAKSQWKLFILFIRKMLKKCQVCITSSLTGPSRRSIHHTASTVTELNVFNEDLNSVTLKVLMYFNFNNATDYWWIILMMMHVYSPMPTLTCAF